MTTDNRPVLVGVDGSPPSIAATTWAAGEALRRGVQLRLVHTYSLPVMASPPLAIAPDGWTEASLRDAAEGVLAEALANARAAAGGLAATGTVHIGLPAPKLVELSREASLVVVGHRGHGGFASLLLGSVAVEVSAHAHAPVVVVRPAPEGGAGRRGIVVGVDGSPGADAALGFAFAESDLRGTDLTVVHSWDPPHAWRADVGVISDNLDELETAERHVLHEWTEGWRAKYPSVPVRYRLTSEHAAASLITASGEADLLVVGSRGRGGFSGLLLGSVSQQSIHHAHCPVVVVRTA